LFLGLFETYHNAEEYLAALRRRPEGLIDGKGIPGTLKPFSVFP